MSRPRIGWIGCGTHANECRCRSHALRRCARGALRHRRGAPRPYRRALRHRCRNRLRDWKELLARDDLDAVGVAAGPAHLDIALAAVARGLRSSSKAAGPRCRRRCASGRSVAGVPVVIGFMKRYSTANRIAANIVRAAEFGSPPRSSANT